MFSLVYNEMSSSVLSVLACIRNREIELTHGSIVAHVQTTITYVQKKAPQLSMVIGMPNLTWNAPREQNPVTGFAHAHFHDFAS